MKKVLSVVLALVLVFSCSVMSFAVSFSTDTRPFENSKYFITGDYTLHYRVFEPAEQANNQIMLFHGFALSTVSLEGIAAEYVKAGYKVVLVDAPDFGYSSRENMDMVFRDREDVIFELMQALGGTWILGGHSMGGGIAINIACDHPDVVTGLVLFAPQVNNQLSSPMDKIARSWIAREMFDGVIWFAVHFPMIVYPMLSTSFSDSKYSKDYDINRIIDPLKIDGTGTGVAIMSSHARTVDYGKFSTLNIPTVIITASNDKVATASVLKKIINNAPQGAVVCNVEKGGHMMMEYSPYLVAELTLPTIANCA